MSMDYKELLLKQYIDFYEEDYLKANKSTNKNIIRMIQKKVIIKTFLNAIEKYPEIEKKEVWKIINIAHVYKKSGETEYQKIKDIVAAENSWKKSSGHAFESIIEILCNKELEKENIKIYLQKDISTLIKDKKICNYDRDLELLNNYIKSSAFDLYITKKKDDKIFVFGVIQSKTSIRDRVTRDREPSIKAMENFFWSIAVVLDGDFLNLPKFKAMVNGNSPSYSKNGWHGMYVFSDNFSNDRIYPIGEKLENIIDHAKIAANYWFQNRQWLNSEWRADK